LSRQHLANHRKMRRQRGTVYVLVLAITSMLVVVGIAGSMLARSQVKQSVLQHNQSSARLAALSMLDITHKQLDGETSWRSVVADDTWDAGTAFGSLDGGTTFDQVTVQIKFVDELDGRIAGDDTQPFRVYARATAGDAVRIYSVELVPDASNNLTRIAHSMRQETDD